MINLASQLLRTIPRTVVLTGLLSMIAGLTNGSASAMSQAPEEMDLAAVLEKALKGIGGRGALEGLNTLYIEDFRERYAMGQGPEPGVGHFRMTRTEAIASYALDDNQFRLDFNHTNHYERSRDVTELVIGQSGYLIGLDDFYLQREPGVRVMRSDRWAVAKKSERLLNPHILLKDLLSDSSPASLADGPHSDVAGRRLSENNVFPVTFVRDRPTGKRNVIANDTWVDRWQGQDFFDLSINELKVDNEWLQRWRDAVALNGTHHQIEVQHAVHPITLHVNAESGRIDKLSTMEHDMVYGDVPLEVTYHDWQQQDGVYFPSHIRISLAGIPYLEVTRSKVVVNPTFEADTFTAPEGVTYEHDDVLATRGASVSQLVRSFTSAGSPEKALGRPRIDSQELADGVYLLEGTPSDAVFTLVVELESGVVVVEPGSFDLKGEAITEWIAENIPGKPISHVIVSHHHSDHSGGVRPYVAAGASTVVHETAVAFYEDLLGRKNATIMPDALDRNPVKADIIAVSADAPTVIEDAVRPITIYPVVSGHTTDMIIVGLEKQEILYSADLYIGAMARLLRVGVNMPLTGEAAQSALELDAAIDATGATFNTLVGSHDREPVSYADFKTYLGNE
ncbi:MAG: MBL fold metallo-hydrolase [Alphaproteobacteria bacterium]|nr:MBL fold metallo-hydrolase [Alphaproteobacteria bacterium]